MMGVRGAYRRHAWRLYSAGLRNFLELQDAQLAEWLVCAGSPESPPERYGRGRNMNSTG